MDVTLRPIADLSEAPGLVGELEAYLAHHGPPSSAAAEPLLRCALTDEAGLVLVALPRGGGERCGFCVTAPAREAWEAAGEPAIVALWTAPDYRHRGLARAMVADARQRLCARGYPRLRAWVEHGDDALISMGERWGFLRAREELIWEEEA